MVHSKLPLLALASTALAGVIQREESEIDHINPGEYYIASPPEWMSAVPGSVQPPTSSLMGFPNEFSDRPQGPHSTYFPSATWNHSPLPSDGSPPFKGSFLGQGEFAHTADTVRPTPFPLEYSAAGQQQQPPPPHESEPKPSETHTPPPGIYSGSVVPLQSSSARPPITSSRPQPSQAASSIPYPALSSSALPSKGLGGVYLAEPSVSPERPPWSYNTPPPFESGPGEPEKPKETETPHPSQYIQSQPPKPKDVETPHPSQYIPSETIKPKEYETPHPFQYISTETTKPKDVESSHPSQYIPSEPPKSTEIETPYSFEYIASETTKPKEYETPHPSQYIQSELPRPKEIETPYSFEYIPTETTKPKQIETPHPSQYIPSETSKPEESSHQLSPPPPPPPHEYEHGSAPIEGGHPGQPAANVAGPSPHYGAIPPLSCPYSATGGYPSGSNPNTIPNVKSPPGNYPPPLPTSPAGNGQGAHVYGASPSQGGPPQGAPEIQKPEPSHPAEYVPHLSKPEPTNTKPVMTPPLPSTQPHPTETSKPHHIYGLPLSSAKVTMKTSTVQSPPVHSQTSIHSAGSEEVVMNSAPVSSRAAVPVGVLVGAVGALILSLAL